MSLRDYPDQFILQYLKFGFPLSLVQSHQLSNSEVKIITPKIYLLIVFKKIWRKKTALGAMMGPLGPIKCEHFHGSPILTRPKDKDKCHIILNLSHHYGGSVNDHVVKNHFDGREFTLTLMTLLTP